jgi:hypothetical protein
MRHERCVCSLRMMAPGEPVHLLQLPRNVLIDVMQRCGNREKAALFATCHSARRLVVGCSQCVSALLKTKVLVHKRTVLIDLADPLALRLTKVSLAELRSARKQLVGVRHLDLVG